MSPKKQSKRARFAINTRRQRKGQFITKSRALDIGAARIAQLVDADIYRRLMDGEVRV